MNGCKFPGELIAGDSVSFLDKASCYSPADGWAMTYRLVPQDAGGDAIELDGTPEGAAFRFVATSETTAEWAVGFYAVASWVERDDERKTLTRGNVTVLPDPATATPGTDSRSQWVIGLAAIDAVIANRATLDQQRYLIEGPNGGRRELWRMTPTELFQMRAHFQRMVDAENIGKCGRTGFTQLKVRI